MVLVYGDPELSHISLFVLNKLENLMQYCIQETARTAFKEGRLVVCDIDCDVHL